jgi:hypothetical protein
MATAFTLNSLSLSTASVFHSSAQRHTSRQPHVYTSAALPTNRRRVPCEAWDNVVKLHDDLISEKNKLENARWEKLETIKEDLKSIADKEWQQVATSTNSLDDEFEIDFDVNCRDEC